MSTVTTIKRGGLTAAIDSMGAQLTSLALDGNEYLWQGDPAFWGKHAPILFPIVGSLRNNTATSAAGTCEMPRHGLARIVEHKLVEVSEDGSSVTYEITDTPESLQAFPFHFKLNMTYALTGDATLTQTFIPFRKSRAARQLQRRGNARAAPRRRASVRAPAPPPPCVHARFLTDCSPAGY